MLDPPNFFTEQQICVNSDRSAMTPVSTYLKPLRYSSGEVVVLGVDCAAEDVGRHVIGRRPVGQVRKLHICPKEDRQIQQLATPRPSLHHLKALLHSGTLLAHW